MAELPSNGSIRAAIIDIDGTLLRSDGTISVRTRRAVAGSISRGVKIVLATGRGFRAASPIAKDLGVSAPLILHNGALVRDWLTGDLLVHQHLAADLARIAARIILRHECQLIVYGNALQGERILAGPAELDSAPAARYLARNGATLTRQPVADFPIVDDPIQLLVLDYPEKAEPLATALQSPRWRTVTSVTTSTPGARLVEVMHADCSKSAAARWLAKSWDIHLSSVLAVGDNFNDLDLLESAGIGVAMGNAPAELQERADWVTATNQEDGVAVALERFVLR